VNVDISQLTPGQFGVSHGSGMTGELIRHATESWAGHAFVYVGNGQLIEGTAPVARIASATEHDDAIWAYRQPLTTDQRTAIVARAHAMVGRQYDYPAYIGFALEVLGLKSGTALDPVFKNDNWRICSALVDDCYQYAGIPLDWSKLKMSTGEDPNLVSPAMLMDLATVNGWV
jgi:hypothetical protein